MKRVFRPLLLAALCWVFVALVPATRHGLGRAATDAWSLPDEIQWIQTTLSFDEEALRLFPDDRRVQLEALANTTDLAANTDKRANQRRIAALSAKLGDDPVTISILLIHGIYKLKESRGAGPLTGGGGAAPSPFAPTPPAPRADWDRFLALARRGQKLEPRNSFFSWMVLYGLFATSRDDEARAELKRAARLRQYDDHSRDIALNRVATARLMHGAPVSVLDSFSVPRASLMRPSAATERTVRWAVESAIADRAANRHARALDTAFGVLQMSRTMRRNSYWVRELLSAGDSERLPLENMIAPNRKMSQTARAMTVPPANSGQNLLFNYAQNHGRPNIARFINRESPELARLAWWRGLPSSFFAGFNMTGNSSAQMATRIAESRARALILFALPWMLGLGAFFALLSHRFRDDSGAAIDGFWRGAVAVGVLLGVTMISDALITLRSGASSAFSSGFPRDSLFIYLGKLGLLSKSPSWAGPGWALAIILVAIGVAVGWQKQQVAPPIAFKTRLKTGFETPEDGLSRFDFGWLLRLIAIATGWLLLLGIFWGLSFNFRAAQQWSEFESADIGNTLLGVAVLASLLLHFWAWRHLPRRRATIRVGWRLISQSLLGGFVASSVLYALLAFAFLPLSLRYDRKFQSAMERGEVQTARAKLGF